MKKKSFITTLLLTIVTLAMSCAVFAACSPAEEPKEERTITWKYDEAAVTIAATGYETLPTTLAEETEVSFTITVKTGYEVTNVTNAKEQTDGTYKFTVGARNLNITITSAKILNDISVTIKKTPFVYFETQTVAASDIEVTANYALGPQVVTDYTITYENGEDFNIGDTSFTVQFGGKEKVVSLDAEVMATQTFTKVGIELDANDNPVWVIEGYYNADGDAAAAKAEIEAFFSLVKEKETWAEKSITANATVRDDKSFTLRVTFSEANSDYYYYLQFRNGKDGSDFACETIDTDHTTVTAKSGMTYTLIQDPFEWGSHPVFLYALNEGAARITDAHMELKDGKPYVVFTGSAPKATQEDVIATLGYIDGTVMSSWIEVGKFIDIVTDEETGTTSSKLTDSAILEIDATNKTFKLYCLLEGDAIQDGIAIFFHAPNSSTNLTLTSTSNELSITCNGFVYSIKTATEIGGIDSWANNLFFVHVTVAE